jgi:hypothetical protein
MQQQGGYVRMTLLLSTEVVESIEKLRIEWGLRSKSAIVNRLLQELLISEAGPE